MSKPAKQKKSGPQEVNEILEYLEGLLSHGFGTIEISVSDGMVKEIAVTRKPLPGNTLPRDVTDRSGAPGHS